MLCFPRERHFLHYSPVSFQALHRNWTNINDSFISSGTSLEVELFVELKIAIINKKRLPSPSQSISGNSSVLQRDMTSESKLIRSKRSFVLNQGWRGGRWWRQLCGSPGTTQRDIWASAAPSPAAEPLQSARWVHNAATHPAKPPAQQFPVAQTCLQTQRCVHHHAEWLPSSPFNVK